jgi:two-component system, NarL family, nitrate/nitrite response regulator NarL
MVDTVRLVLIDDHPLLREGVAYALSNEPDFEVVGQGADAETAINLAREHTPDVMLLDISMPGGGGLRAAEVISTEFPVIKIIMLTASESEENVLGAFKAGARGCVLKGVGGSEIVRIVRSILAGEPYVTPKLAAGLLGDARHPSTKSSAEANLLAELTRREREILELVAVGQSNKEVARNLNLTEKTIKYNMTNILQKLQVRNRVEAALLARAVTTPAPSTRSNL